MRRHGVLLGSLVITLLIAAVQNTCAADQAAQSLATRPYYSIFAASIDRLVDVCHVVFDSVGRQDLADSFSERRKSVRDFAGINRDKPLGIMSVWNDSSSADIVFLPVEDIKELLTTATFGVVPFHRVSDNRFEIERPGSPYHVLVRKEYAFFADSTESIQALQVTPDRLTRAFRDRYDVVVALDLKQIPQTIKAKYVDDLRSQVEPWLQPQDDEPVETANLRKAIGKTLLDIFQRIMLDTTEVSFGGRLDPKTRHLIFEATIEAGKGTPLANGLNKLVSRRNEFAPMISPDVPAGLALNLPLDSLVAQVLGSPVETAQKGQPLELGIQLVGREWGKLSFIGAIRGDKAVDLNNAVPRWIIKLDESGKFETVSESFDIHEGVVFHSLVPRDLPDTLKQVVGPDSEVIVGQGAEIIWLGIGPPETLLAQMKDAIDSIAKSTDHRVIAPLVRARFQAKQIPELVAAERLSSNLDAEASKNAFAHGEDGFSITLDPIANGIKLRIEAEEGFVRLLGTDWAKQIDDSRR